MSLRHPVIAVTGANGAGTTVVQQAFKEIFFRQNINAIFMQGDGFLRFSDEDTQRLRTQAMHNGRKISCYGPEFNDFSRLEACFKGYAENGSESLRYKISEENRHLYNEPVGGFTQWQPMPPNSDCLFYEGMHGGVVSQSWTRRKSDQGAPDGGERRQGDDTGVNAAQYVDLLIGVVPAINLEWIQRIHHDQYKLRHSVQQVTENILHQLEDYMHFIVPQFSLADINFQRMPVVDTSNPFAMDWVPGEDESIIVVSFRQGQQHNLFHYQDNIEGSFISRQNNLVIPGGQFKHALDVICAPMIEALISRSQAAR